MGLSVTCLNINSGKFRKIMYILSSNLGDFIAKKKKKNLGDFEIPNPKVWGYTIYWSNITEVIRY